MMQLEVGQVYRAYGTDLTVLVLEVRDEKHPKGLGEGYGDSACAWPIDLRASSIAVADLHPFDVRTLCGALPSHGDEVWDLVVGVRYLLRLDDPSVYEREETS